jgi:hypothetical protein
MWRSMASVIYWSTPACAILTRESGRYCAKFHTILWGGGGWCVCVRLCVCASVCVRLSLCMCFSLTFFLSFSLSLSVSLFVHVYLHQRKVRERRKECEERGERTSETVSTRPKPYHLNPSEERAHRKQ